MNEIAMNENQVLGQYHVTPEIVREMVSRYDALAINGVEDTEGREIVHAARMDLKKTRVAVEARRKELKEGALTFGRMVDSAARQLTAPIVEVESRLLAEEEAYRAELARIAEAKIDARAAQLADLGSRVDRGILRIATDDQFASMIETATAEKHAREVAAAEAEKARLDELERQRIEREEAEKARQEQLAQLKAEREKLEEEKRQADEAQRLAEERLEADRQKVADEQKRLRDIEAKLLAAEHERLEEVARVARECRESVAVVDGQRVHKTCPHCGSQNAMPNPVEWSQNERPYSCIDCGKSFSDGKTLDAAIEVVQDRDRENFATACSGIALKYKDPATARTDREKLLGFTDELANLTIPPVHAKELATRIRGVVDSASAEIVAMIKAEFDA